MSESPIPNDADLARGPATGDPQTSRTASESESLTDDDKGQLRTISDTSDPQDFVRLLRTYYWDGNRAARTPRTTMYFHLGLLSGMLLKVLDRETR